MRATLTTLRCVAVLATLVLAVSCGDNDNPEPCSGSNCVPDGSVPDPDKGTKPLPDEGIKPDQPKASNCPQPKGLVKCSYDDYKGEQHSPTLDWRSWNGKSCVFVRMKHTPESTDPGKYTKFERSDCVDPNGKPL